MRYLTVFIFYVIQLTARFDVAFFPCLFFFREVDGVYQRFAVVKIYTRKINEIKSKILLDLYHFYAEN